MFYLVLGLELKKLFALSQLLFEIMFQSSKQDDCARITFSFY